MTARSSSVPAGSRDSGSDRAAPVGDDPESRPAVPQRPEDSRPLRFSRAEALRRAAAKIADEEGGPRPAASGGAVPNYLEATYHWAYLNPTSVWLLDRPAVVYGILWGQAGRLARAAASELDPGQSVLQAASVYGSFSRVLAERLGPDGRLEVVDVAPVQVANCRRKLADYPQVTVRLADARAPGDGLYDAVCCFFLLHEVPDDAKRAVVDALLERVAPGGRVVFVDYHKPHWAHPLKPLMSVVFDTLEPFAKGLWRHEIVDLANLPDRFAWRKETYFGGLYQKVVAERKH